MPTKKKPTRIDVATAGKGSRTTDTRRLFGQHLKKLMLDRSWSQSDVSRSVFGTADKRYLVSKWLNGVVFPDAANMGALAKAFNVEPDELLPLHIKAAYDELETGIDVRVLDDQPGYGVLVVRKVVPLASIPEIVATIASHSEKSISRKPKRKEK